MNEPFFIGWSDKLPPGLRRPMLGVALGLLVCLAALAFLLARGADDPGRGNWAGDATLRGTFSYLPYPLLHLPSGHTVMLSAFGKAQVMNPAIVDGASVEASGPLVRRGDLEMLVVNDPARLHPIDEKVQPPNAPVQLGRWRMVGEICDGKCATGVMRPGAGIAHRACASLCLLGDIPPVFVGVQPAEGSEFFLLAGPDGGPMPLALRRLLGLRVQLDGALERQGDLLVFKVDPASAEVI
jgi:hypothetical protein